MGVSTQSVHRKYCLFETELRSALGCRWWYEFRMCSRAHRHVKMLRPFFHERFLGRFSISPSLFPLRVVSCCPAHILDVSLLSLSTFECRGALRRIPVACALSPF